MCYLIVEFCSSHVKSAAKVFDEKLQEQKVEPDAKDNEEGLEL